MNPSQFSEKMFETLINHLILNRLEGAHVFIPSQAKEHSDGFDVLFSDKTSGKKKVLLIQYKIVQEYKRSCDGLAMPVFRFDLHRDGKTGEYIQHNILIKNNKQKGYTAGYCVPGFITWSDLYNYYRSNNSEELLNNSFFVSSHKKISDTKSHFIRFNSSIANLHSKESFPCEICTVEKLVCECEKKRDEISAKEFIEEVYSRIPHTKYDNQYKRECVNKYLAKESFAVIVW